MGPLALILGLGLTACAAILGLDDGTPRSAADSADSGVAESGAGGEGGAVAALPGDYGDITDPSRWETFDLSAVGATATPPAPGDGTGQNGQPADPSIT